MRIVLAAVSWSSMVNSYPPLGLGYLAAVLQEDPEVDAEVEILDFGLTPNLTHDQALEQILGQKPPEILGFSALTNNFSSTLELAKKVKAKAPSVRVVLGGPHPSVDPKTMAGFDPIDAVVFGEGEMTFLELVKKAAKGQWADQTPGLAYQRNGEVILNQPRELIKDLDSLPFPARNLMRIHDYSLRSLDNEPIYTLLTSRGCPYSCAYCFKGVFGKRYRTRSPENVISEIQELKDRYGARHFYFGDDIFMLNEKRVKRVCEGLLERGLDISWSCLARVDIVTPDLLKLMKSAGCSKIHYGIESGCQDILDRIKKKIDLTAIKQAVLWTREAGILSKGYFMAGLPGDTEETMEHTLAFAKSLPLDEVMFSLTTPFPGTALHDALAVKGQAPQLEDFNRAFYFDDGGGDVKVFFNLSEVEDKKLEDFVSRAQLYFKRQKNKNAFKRRYGALLGPFAYGAWRLLGQEEKD